MKNLCLMLAFVLLAACAGKVEYRYVDRPLSAPPKPVLPSIEEKELLCLSEPAYKALVKRDLLLQQHIESLRLIIKSTQNQDDDDGRSR